MGGNPRRWHDPPHSNLMTYQAVGYFRVARNAGTTLKGAARLWSTFNYQMAHLSGPAALVLEFRIKA